MKHGVHFDLPCEQVEKIGAQTWGDYTDLKTVSFAPTINSIGAFATGHHRNHVAGELLAPLAHLTIWMKAQDINK